jgi:hypothetical protein
MPLSQQSRSASNLAGPVTDPAIRVTMHKQTKTRNVSCDFFGHLT